MVALSVALNKYNISDVSAAATTTVPSTVKLCRTQSYRSSVPGVGGAEYERVTAQPSHALRFRTLDRYMPDGSTDGTNGGWWSIIGAEVDITQAGAVMDGSTDDLTVLNNISVYLASIGGGKITFPPNVSVKVTAQIGYGLNLSNADEIAIDLNDSTLISSSGFFNGACGIAIRNGTLQSPGQFTQGTVTTVSGAYWEFEADPAFLPTFSTGSTYVQVDTDNGAIINKRDITSGAEYALTDRTGGIYRVADTPPSWVSVGDKVVVTYRKYGASGVYNVADGLAGEGLKLQNLVIQGTPGMFTYVIGTVDPIIENVTIKPADGAWCGCNADGIHLIGARGTVSISNLSVKGSLDDGLNLHARYWSSVSTAAADAVTATMLPTAKVGDIVSFMDANMVEQDQLVVESVVGSTTVTFTENLPGSFNASTWTLLNLSDLPDSVIVDGLSVKQCNARSALIQTKSALISNVIGDGLLGAGFNIGVGTVGFPTESGAAANSVSLSNYIFHNCGKVNTETVGQSIINVKSLNRSDATAGDGPNKGILIGQGEVSSCGYGVLAIEGGEVTVDGLQMRDTGLLRSGGTSDGDYDVVIIGADRVDIRSMVHKDGTGTLKVDTASLVYAEEAAITGFKLSGAGAPQSPPVLKGTLNANPRIDTWTTTTASISGGSGSYQALGATGFIFSVPAAGAWTWSQQLMALEDSQIEGGPTYFLRLDETTGHTGYPHAGIDCGDLAQVSNQKIPVALWLKSATAGSFYLRSQQYFGSGGSSAVYGTASTTMSVTSTWTKFIRTVDVGTLVSKTRGANNKLYIDIVPSSSGQVYDLDIGPCVVGMGAVVPALRAR